MNMYAFVEVIEWIDAVLVLSATVLVLRSPLRRTDKLLSLFLILVLIASMTGRVVSILRSTHMIAGTAYTDPLYIVVVSLLFTCAYATLLAHIATATRSARQTNSGITAGRGIQPSMNVSNHVGNHIDALARATSPTETARLTASLMATLMQGNAAANPTASQASTKDTTGQQSVMPESTDRSSVTCIDCYWFGPAFLDGDPNKCICNYGTGKQRPFVVKAGDRVKIAHPPDKACEHFQQA